jgi:hypothetical protein
MAKEMEPFGVGVTCILPGAVADTQFRARSGTRQALCWYMPFYPRSPESVAHQGIVSVLDGDSQTIPGWQNRIFANIVRPIIPQRFEIMCVQAAFTPFQFPKLKDLFQQDKKYEKLAEVNERSESPPAGNGYPWIPSLEPLYKNKPVPRILTLPEEEKEKTEEMKEEPPVEKEPVIEEQALDSSQDKNSQSNVVESDSNTKESELVEEECEILDRAAEKIKKEDDAEAEVDIPEQQTPALVKERAKTSLKITDDQSEVPGKKKVVATLEIEEEMIVDESEDDKRSNESKEPKQSTTVEEDGDDTRKGSAIEGGRRRTKTVPTPPASSSFEEDQDDDTMFSPRLGPIDIMEHRRLTLPKRSDTTTLLMGPPIIIV